jgi:hypothetical protein
MLTGMVNNGLRNATSRTVVQQVSDDNGSFRNIVIDPTNASRIRYVQHGSGAVSRLATFGQTSSWTSGSCTATWTKILSATSPGQLVWGPSGRASPDDMVVWVGLARDNAALRVDPTGAMYAFTMPVSSSPSGGPAMLTNGSTGYFWTVNSASLFRIQP